MIDVECEYLGSNVTVQAKLTDKMSLVFQKFKTKAQINNASLIFLYKGSKINEDLPLEQVISSDDKKENKMKIVVNSLDSQQNGNSSTDYFSENIICPHCEENCTIKMENCRISFNCKNGHNQENILLDEFKKTQVIDLKKRLVINVKKKIEVKLTIKNFTDV